MAEEGKSSSPRRSKASSVWDERPSGIDRKSLSGMSDSVKAILAPLLGGTKRHSEIEVDLGRDPDSDSAYLSVPTGTTSQHRYSTVETLRATAVPSDTGTSTDTSGKVSQPRSSYAFETLDRGTTLSAPEVSSDTETSTDPSAKIRQPRASHAPRSSYVPRTTVTPRSSYASETLQEIKGKNELKTDDGPPRTGSPLDTAYASVDKLLPATKPKMEEYDNYLKEARPQLRARVGSILADKSHEAGFERRLPGGEEFPKLEDARPVYGEASEVPRPTGRPSLFDKMKDTVTGQLPGKGVYSGKATIDHTSDSDHVPSVFQNYLPVQDAGTGSTEHARTVSGKFARDAVSEPEEGSGVPRHMNGPNEDLAKST